MVRFPKKARLYRISELVVLPSHRLRENREIKLFFGESHENKSLGMEIITVRHFKNPGQIWDLAKAYLGVWAKKRITVVTHYRTSIIFLCPLLFAPIYFSSRRLSTSTHMHRPPLCCPNPGKPHLPVQLQSLYLVWMEEGSDLQGGILLGRYFLMWPLRGSRLGSSL